MKPFFLLALSLLFFTTGCSTLKKDVLLDTDNLPLALRSLADGASVKLAAREYRLDEVLLLENKNNIKIDGNGATFVMKSLSENVLHLTGCTNIQLTNFKATHIEPSGPTDCTGNVIYMDESSDILIQDCDLNGSGIVGIAAYNTDNLRVVDNYIHENSEYAIIYQGPSLLLTNNVFEENGNGNVIYFSYVPKDGVLGWPPEEKIGADTQMQGLVMRDNNFKN